MALEEPLAGNEAGGAPKPKKSAIKLTIIIIVSLLFFALLAGGGVLMYSQIGGGLKAEKAKAEVQLEKEREMAARMGEIMALDPFIVNLAGESGKRYLKVAMQMELSTGILADEVNNKMPQIKDSIITVLSSKTTDELLTIEGKFKLKEQLLTRINSILNTGVVKNVYFVEFVIQ